ncbi:MAG TPA: hypothetical protein PJ988_05145, partial [Anaerolinea sp.]|nr:hypothetical protein [Anaerolinea sp.]
AVGSTWDSGPLSIASAAETATWGGFLVDYFQATQPGGLDDPTPPLLVAKDFDIFLVHLPVIVRP